VFKKLGYSVALAFALLGGGVAASMGAPAAVTTSVAVSQAAPVVQLASLATAPVSAEVAQLSVAQMSDVQGDGWWKKFKKWLKKVIKKVIGVIVAEIVTAINEWIEEIFSSVDGGETVESSDVQTRDYASQADYDIDNAYADNTQVNSWQQTDVWYGSGGSCGGTQERQVQMYQMEEQICQAY
jgi:hypothetical protein